MFILNAYGSQEEVAQFLESTLPHSLISDAGDYCRLQIYRIVCNYYLIPCGNASNMLPPSSICPDECSVVEKACPSVWEALTQELKFNKPFLSCNDTSKSLIPLPNCCTGVGIEEISEGSLAL